MAQFLRSTFHWPEEPGAHQGTWHLSGAAILATVMLDSQLTPASRPLNHHVTRLLSIYGVSPVLVEAAFALITDVFGEDGLEGAQATGGVDVTHDANHNHGRSLHDGDRLHDFFLVHLCKWRTAAVNTTLTSR